SAGGDRSEAYDFVWIDGDRRPVGSRQLNKRHSSLFITCDIPVRLIVECLAPAQYAERRFRAGRAWPSPGKESPGRQRIVRVPPLRPMSDRPSDASLELMRWDYTHGVTRQARRG